MPCDPNQLLEDAKCILRCIPNGSMAAAQLAALCNLSSQSLNGLQVGTDLVTNATFVVSPDASAPVTLTRHVDDNAPVIMRLQKMGTTGNIDGAPSNNDNLARLDFYAWDGDSFDSAAVIQATAAEGWTLAAHGTRLTFNLVATGATATTEMLRLTATMADLRNGAVLGSGGTQVVGPRNLGWTTFTGASTKDAGGFDTGTVTTAQLASVVKAMFDALVTHGLIGP